MRGMRMSRARTARMARWSGLLIGALLIAGCSSGQSEETPMASTDGMTAGAAGSAPDATAILDMVHPDRSVAPTELGVLDLTVGEGRSAAAGDRVVVQYHGLRWSDGGSEDASWTRGQPYSFELGRGQVIQGWDLGVAGMQPGGRRVLTIPPGLAYGDRGAGGVIGPGETLVFIVDLVEVSGS